MSVLLIAVAVIAVCIATALLLPLDISGNLTASQELSASFEGRWGVIGIRASERYAEFMLFSYPVFRKPFGEEKEEETEEEEEEEKPKSTTDKLKDALSLWPEIRGPLKGFLRQVSIKRIHCDLTIGLGDPASTGVCYGMYHAVKGMLTPVHQISLMMRPDFTSLAFRGEAGLDIRIRRALLSALPFAIVYIRRRQGSA